MCKVTKLSIIFLLFFLLNCASSRVKYSQEYNEYCGSNPFVLMELHANQDKSLGPLLLGVKGMTYESFHGNVELLDKEEFYSIMSSLRGFKDDSFSIKNHVLPCITVDTSCVAKKEGLVMYTKKDVQQLFFKNFLNKKEYEFVKEYIKNYYNYL